MTEEREYENVRDQYMNDPEKYCVLMIQKLRDAVFFKKVLDPSLIHLHDAVYHVGEKVDLVDPDKVKGPPQWWEEEAILSEFKGVPRPSESPEKKVDWYMKNS